MNTKLYAVIPLLLAYCLVISHDGWCSETDARIEKVSASVSRKKDDSPPKSEKMRGMDAPNRIPQRYIVVIEDSSAEDYLHSNFATNIEEAVSLVSQDLTWKYGGTAIASYSYALKGFAIEGIRDVDVWRMSQDPDVAYIEADQFVELFQSQSPAVWGLDRIDQRNLPLNNIYQYGGTGAGVNVYVIDSGIYPNNEFGTRLRSTQGYTAINDGYGTSDCNGHGTHVAGTIGGSVHGVAKGVALYPVRVFGCSTQNAPMSLVIAGINWVFSNRINPAVANMSFGYSGSTSSLDQATTNLINAGVVVVAAAGNSSTNACNYSPAKVSSVITVGGTTSSDEMYDLSNFGSCVDVYAPAENVQSSGLGQNAVATMSGTSMAAPHVAGWVARIKASTPSASPGAIAQQIRDTATTRKIVNASGPVSCRNANGLLFTGQLSPPGLPAVTSNLQIEKMCSNKYLLSWSSVPSTTAYEIYVTHSAESGCESYVTSTTSVFATVSGGVIGGSAKYRVRACNSVGCGGYSLPKTAAYYSGCP